jgi:pyruvate,water dikinase
MAVVIVDLRAATAATCGGKAATLGELLRAGIRVPDGFVVPPGPFREADLTPFGDVAVAVRSSATTEDTEHASAAGQHDSYLGVRGAHAVAEKIRACRESLWSPRAMAYRRAQNVGTDPEMAVLVQRHVDAEASGVLFTGTDVRIEASWGLGESVVRGLVTPDSWTVSPAGISARTVGDKAIRIDRSPTGTAHHPVAEPDRKRPCLSDDQVHRVAAAGRTVEAVLGRPVDVEWALTGDRIWVLQARPVTVAAPSRPTAPRATAATVLTGSPGSPGTVTGPARVLTGPRDFARAAAGDIVVCRTTDPAWTPLFATAAGFVTETGGVLSHAAIVAREHGIPAVLGVPGAMTVLRDGHPVTVDGEAGTVHIERGAAVDLGNPGPLFGPQPSKI